MLVQALSLWTVGVWLIRRRCSGPEETAMLAWTMAPLAGAEAEGCCIGQVQGSKGWQPENMLES